MKLVEKHGNYDSATGTYSSFVIGFVLSLITTITAYLIVVNKYFSSFNQAIVIITSLAIIQLFVQLVFFLHLGRESKPRWNAMAFVFAGIVVLVVVLGSIWIMNNLDYNMKHSDKEIIKDELNHQ
jgi:cytochrome o ubiquinol oxidase operon protein cyoD